MPDVLTGMVTFVYAEIVRSAGPRPRLPSHVPEGLSARQRALQAAFEQAGAEEVRTTPTGVLAAFCRPTDAVNAAVSVQLSVAPRRRHAGDGADLRIGLYTVGPAHTVPATSGLDMQPAARVCAVAHPGQILIAESTRALLSDPPPPGVAVWDLGRHRLRDLQHVEHLFLVTHPDLPAGFPPPTSLDTRPNNLPLQLTRFVGREREIVEVGHLLAGARLLTLTGVGGSGKTRLAVQVAAASLDGYPDGVWLVEFAPLVEASLVPHTVAAALAAPEQPDRRVIDTLVDALRLKVVLLVFDNCEHVLSACAETTAALLQRCPTLQVLATSQEALGIAGEVTYPVPALSLPPSGSAPTLEGLREYESVRLFLDRAARARSGFALGSDNAGAVLQICQRLDGVPLALELAAACLKVLTVEQIAERLHDRFRLLSGGSRTGLPRHQTLRAVMDWSYDLLATQEKALLRRLSVFAGGWTLEAAESICSGDCLEAPVILGLLGRLVEKSLVAAETHGDEMRYGVLDTVRQYGRDRLVDRGEAPKVRSRHARWYLRLAERGDAELRGPQQAVWLKRLETEHDNFRVALEWSRADTAANPGTAVQLAAALYWFWFIRGYWNEGRGWLEDARTMSVASGEPGNPKVLLGAAHLARQQGDYAQATMLLERGLALCDRIGEVALVPWLLLNQGLVASYEGDAANAMSLFEQSLARSRALDDRWLTSMSLAQLGGVHMASGDYKRAAALFNESLAVSREVGDRYRIAFALRGLGTVALRRGDYPTAAAHYRESLAVSGSVREGWVTEESLAGLAGVAAALGYGKRAGQLFGAAEVLRETLGLHRLAADEPDYAQRVAAARAGLGEAGLRRAWAEGRAMGLDRAVDLALAPLETVGPGAETPAREKAPEGAERLTRRERDVAALVAQGQTNRQIASHLVISERTADTHLQNILNKLGFNSRAQIAAWAVEHGLLKATRDR